MEVASIVASFVSVVLAVVAIFISLYFYNQSKNVETKVISSLESIKAQTETLQKLSGRWMDRLTKYVTDSRPNEDVIIHLFTAIKDLQTNIVSKLKVPNYRESQSELTSQLVACYVALYYYVALTNYWSQLSLPPLEKYDENSEYFDIVKDIVDTSFSDFNMVANILSKLDPKLIENCSTSFLLEDAVKVWRPLVKNTTLVFSEREKEGY